MAEHPPNSPEPASRPGHAGPPSGASSSKPAHPVAPRAAPHAEPSRPSADPPSGEASEAADTAAPGPPSTSSTASPASTAPAASTDTVPPQVPTAARADPTGGRGEAVRGPRRWAGPYTRLFALPGTVAFTAGNLLARLPIGMFNVSAIVMIAGARGSYALAGAVTAVGLAATALLAPLIARLIDRHGQARVALPATLVAVGGAVALAACVRYSAPTWALFATYATVAATPNTGGMSRARWHYLYREDAHARHTANSLEQALDELCFTLGPVLAAMLSTAVFPEAGTLTAAALLLVGMLLFTAQRRTEPPVVREQDDGDGAPRAVRSPLRLPGMATLLVTFLCTGAVFGSLEVVTIAYADAEGHKAVGGVILAFQAFGSGAAGLVFGALTLRGSADRRLPRCLGAMSVLMGLPLLVTSTVGSLPLLAFALLVAGIATAPTMVTGMTLVQQRTPRAQLTEGMTLAVTAMLSGIATGSALGGWLTEHLSSPSAPYLLPLSAACTALLTTLLRRLSRNA